MSNRGRRGRSPQPVERVPRVWPELLLALAVTLGFLALRPFGQLVVVERYGQVVFTQVFSPWLYTRPGGEPGAGARDRTVVVLLQDDDLARLRWSWPVPYEAHALVLREIRRRGPAALVMDFLFLDRRPEDQGLEDLVEELREYRHAGIPAFLASASVPGPVPAVIPELGEAATGAQLVPVPRLLAEGAESTYPLAFDRCEEMVPQGSSCRRRTRRPTAAAAVYRHLCGGASARSCAGPVLHVGGPRELPADTGDPPGGAAPAPRAELFWGTKPEPLSARRLRCGDPPAPTVVRRLATAAWRGDALRQDCPFTPTVYVAWLLAWGAWEDPDLRRLVQGRVVFYGASLAGMSDLVRPPGHEPLPGVYLHAMALDNLLTFGADYRRSEAVLGETRAGRVLGGWLPGPVRQWTVVPDHVAVVTVVVLQLGLLAPLLRLQRRWTGPGQPGPGRRLLVGAVCWLIYAVAATLVVLAFTWAQWYWLNLTVGNWLEGFLDAILGKHIAARVKDQLLHA